VTRWVGFWLLVGVAVPGATAARQVRPRPDSTRTPADSIRRDSLGIPVDSLGRPVALDTAAAARLGLPSAPSRTFPASDSIIEALLKRSGYRVTRYASDTVTFLAPANEILLRGSSLIEREGTTLEAEHVEFRQERCVMVADGEPVLFESGTVLVGDTMSYDTCELRGTVAEAFTSFNQDGVDWFLRGGLGIDSGAARIYAGSGRITSCDLEDPHFYFAASRMKWVNNHILVARSTTLYIRDVPIMWFPFIFQDMRQGRRTGMLTPRFGINDLVRPNQGYRRHITNVGYYVAINDYMDAQVSLDWLAGTSVSINGEFQYRWLNRFMTGDLSVSRIFESGRDGRPGRRSLRLLWTHQQDFNQRTSLNASVDFASSSSVIEQNTVDPLLQTAELQSRVNFRKQFDWGTLTIGGNRSQSLSDDRVTENLPLISLTPSPISLGSNVTWSPSFSLNNNRVLNQRVGLIELPPQDGVFQEPDTLFGGNRTTTLSVNTPLRIGRWNWQNSFVVTDQASTRRQSLRVTDPTDTTQSNEQVFNEDFSTAIDWNTGINLPLLFPSTWKLQPTLGIRNATGGPFMIRNRATGGRFVQQGKRLSFGASLSPSLFGFFPGVGPLSRIRHAISPQISWAYSPSADVNEEYLRALNPGATTFNRRSPATHTIQMGLSQTFEGKFAVPEGEDSSSTAPTQARKLKILNWQTSAIQYDFEQAKKPGRNGWRTQSITNSFTSDLLRGFSLRMTHDLWDGPVGFDTTRFDPFLRSVSARFSISGQLVSRLFGALFGGRPLEAPSDEEETDSLPPEPDPLDRGRTAGPRTAFRSVETLGGGRPRGRGFTSSLTYDDQRTRRPVVSTNPLAAPTANRTLGVTMAFSPTRDWSLSWNTQYNFTTREFGQQVLRFDRDLHHWTATFGFTRAPNGNFAFTFFVNLRDQPEIKFNYDQQTVRR